VAQATVQLDHQFELVVDHVADVLARLPIPVLLASPTRKLVRPLHVLQVAQLEGCLRPLADVGKQVLDQAAMRHPATTG